MKFLIDGEFEGLTAPQAKQEASPSETLRERCLADWHSTTYPKLW
jgi:hypothetical protein